MKNNGVDGQSIDWSDSIQKTFGVKLNIVGWSV